MKSSFRVMTIAGSDSGGGAGIQADLKTISALGCHATTVITALTAQNTCAVKRIFPVPPDFIGSQIDAVMDDIGTDAVKIGMVYSFAAIQTIAERLRYFKPGNIVIDPVMISGSGKKLLCDEAVEALKKDLFPLAKIVTPNLPETAALIGLSESAVSNLLKKDPERLFSKIRAIGCEAVLVKGGHGKDAVCTDVLFEKNGATHCFSMERLHTENTHGTGCTLSSAIASFLAGGITLPEAVSRAKTFIHRAIATGCRVKIGKGNGPVNPFHGAAFSPIG